MSRQRTAQAEEGVRSFDWRAAFPEVRADGDGGFDIVLGNPPYVKPHNLIDDQSLTSGIIVGIQTSADYIYHHERLGTDRYKCKPRGRGAAPYEVEVEDAIMKPLVSGPDAKRYEDPQTNTYPLFPYERDPRGMMNLIPVGDLARRFPRAWAHLRTAPIMRRP